MKTTARALAALAAFGFLAAPASVMANPDGHPTDHPTSHPTEHPTEHPGDHPKPHAGR